MYLGKILVFLIFFFAVYYTAIFSLFLSVSYLTSSEITKVSQPIPTFRYRRNHLPPEHRARPMLPHTDTGQGHNVAARAPIVWLPDYLSGGILSA